MIHKEYNGNIAIVRMEHGKVNAMDIRFFHELNSVLDLIEISPEASAVILTSEGKTFSAGVDLPRLLEHGAEYVREFVPVMVDAFEKLVMFPKPLIAAVNGHAIAGGCILACCCDYRLMSDSDGMIGIPELNVGVPFPAIALEIMRAVVAPQYFQQVVYLAQNYHPKDAMKVGLVDEVVPKEELMSRAGQIAEKFAAVPADAFRIVKQQIRKPVMDLAKSIPQQEVEAVWESTTTHEFIREYLGKTLRKK